MATRTRRGIRLSKASHNVDQLMEYQLRERQLLEVVPVR